MPTPRCSSILPPPPGWLRGRARDEVREAPLVRARAWLLAVPLLSAPAAGAPRPPAAPAVRAWMGTETIVTYEEGPPDPNPPFDLFSGGRFNYPYTMRETLTGRSAPRLWRTLNLENEHLRVTVLPDLGGRLWRCVDKANGAEMF